MNILSIITFIRPKDGQKVYQPLEYKQRGKIGLKLIRQVMSHPLATGLFQSPAVASFAPSTYAPITQSTLMISSLSMLSPSLSHISILSLDRLFCMFGCRASYVAWHMPVHPPGL